MKTGYRINVKIEKATRDNLRKWCDKNHQQMGWTIDKLIKEFLKQENSQNEK